MSKRPGYIMRITHSGPPSRPFGWKLCQQGASPKTMVIGCSTINFRTRGEAVADSVSTAVLLAPSLEGLVINFDYGYREDDL
jgi:hypothetical protein